MRLLSWCQKRPAMVRLLGVALFSLILPACHADSRPAPPRSSLLAPPQQRNRAARAPLGQIASAATGRPQIASLLEAPRGGGATSPSLGWPIFVSFLYFLSIAMTAPALPAFCNSLFSAGGEDKVNSRGVSLYGTFTSIDQLFTFLFVGFWGAVSDHVGRKPLIVM